MKKIWHSLNNDRGSVIIVALMVLSLLTIIGFAATNMSTTELSISTNSLLYERAFYTAEAALQHAKETLRAPFVVQNQALIAGGGNGNWTFALDGSLAAAACPSSDPMCAVDDPDDGLGAVPIVSWIQAGNIKDINYQVRIWDNDDDPGPQDYTTDSDGLIFVRAEAWEAVRGGRCKIEELVEGTTIDPQQTSGYTAQEGAGSGKVYTSNDAEAIDFNDPGFGQQI